MKNAVECVISEKGVFAAASADEYKVIMLANQNDYEVGIKTIISGVDNKNDATLTVNDEEKTYENCNGTNLYVFYLKIYILINLFLI